MERKKGMLELERESRIKLLENERKKLIQKVNKLELGG